MENRDFLRKSFNGIQFTVKNNYVKRSFQRGIRKLMPLISIKHFFENYSSKLVKHYGKTDVSYYYPGETGNEVLFKLAYFGFLSSSRHLFCFGTANEYQSVRTRLFYLIRPAEYRGTGANKQCRNNDQSSCRELRQMPPVNAPNCGLKSPRHFRSG